MKKKHAGIHSRQELREWIYEDRKRNGYPRFYMLKGGLKDLVLHNEKYFIFRLLTELRHVEYYQNCGRGIISRCIGLWHFFLYKNLCWKTKCIVNPNTTGPGLVIYHLGSFMYVRKGSCVGRNFTMVGGVVLGRGGDGRIVIGDNVYCGLNVTIVGDVSIGDNVKIGAHAVVTKDIPTNSVAVGVPAKVIKHLVG